MKKNRNYDRWLSRLFNAQNYKSILARKKDSCQMKSLLMFNVMPDNGWQMDCLLTSKHAVTGSH